MQKEKRGKKLFLDFLLLAAGAIIAAFAIEEFLVPNTILDGGVVGVSIMINTLSGFPLGVLTAERARDGRVRPRTRLIVRGRSNKFPSELSKT